MPPTQDTALETAASDALTAADADNAAAPTQDTVVGMAEDEDAEKAAVVSQTGNERGCYC